MIQYLIIVLLLFIWLYLLAGRIRPGAAEPPPPRALPLAEVPAAVPEVMDVAAATEEDGVLVFRGALRWPPDEAYRRLRDALPAALNPYLRQGEDGNAVVLLTAIVSLLLPLPHAAWPAAGLHCPYS